MSAKHVHIRRQGITKEKDWKENEKKRQNRNERKRKPTSQISGPGNYASFSTFNQARSPTTRLTVIGLLISANDTHCLRLLNILTGKCLVSGYLARLFLPFGMLNACKKCWNSELKYGIIARFKTCITLGSMFKDR